MAVVGVAAAALSLGSLPRPHEQQSAQVVVR
jgi:hypothetical protein